MIFRKTTVKGRFVNETGFVIDFRHLIRQNNLIESPDNFVIEHWNKPAKLWGYFDSHTGDYFLLPVDQLSQPFYKVGERISIPYHDLIKPTDAILFINTRAIVIENKLTLVEDI